MVNATVTLYKDVGLTPAYSRTIDFTSKSAQTAWFNRHSAGSMTVNANYNKLENSFAIHEPVGDIYGYSYVRIIDLDDSDRTYYGFITNAVLVDDETTRFDIQIDPIQTFMCEFEIDESFVLKEHIDRWEKEDDVPIITPSNYKTSNYMDIETYGDIISTLSFAKVVVIAFTSDNYDTVVDKTPMDKIYFAYAIVHPNEPDTSVYGIRAGREAIEDGNGNFSDNVWADFVKFPSYTMIANGSFLDLFGIDPNSVISISVLPFAQLHMYSSGSTVPVEFSGFVGHFNYDVYGRDVTYPPYSGEVVPRGSKPGYWWVKVGTSQVGKVIVGQLDRGEGGKQDFAPVINGTIDSSTPANDNEYMLVLLDTSVVPRAEYGTIETVGRPYCKKPVDGDIASDIHEPMMQIAPFRETHIVDYKGTDVLTVPDNIVLRTINSNNLYLNTKPILDVSGIQLGISVTQDAENGFFGIYSTIGNLEYYKCDSLPFVNDTWLSYKLTAMDTDRSNAMLQAMASIITGGIYGAYGGALVGSRSASGDKDSDERRNTLLKRGAIGASIIGGASSVLAGAVNGAVVLQTQKNKESGIKNKASTVTNVTSVQSFSNECQFYSVILRCDDYNYNTGYANFKYYGYSKEGFEKPNLRSRKYYNYILTQGAIIKGALNGDIKDAISKIFDTGITIFHGDYCDSVDYPTNSDGEELENIERSLLS